MTNLTPVFWRVAALVAFVVAIAVFFIMDGSSVFLPLTILVFAIALLFMGDYVNDRSQTPEERKLPHVTRAVDFIYFIAGLPIVLTIFHELIICTFVPSFGLHGADDPASCTVGWGIFFLIYILPVWIIGTLSFAIFRVRALVRLGKRGRAMLVLYGIFGLIPALGIASLFFL
ncbi:MAG: hypothetical protein KBD05_02310 [Candidatus Pacebacteria bacterium]|nr:hypothetical protein [Candidatus Paceibacterota bacterium]